MVAIRTGQDPLGTRKGGTLHMRRPFYLTALENGDFGEDDIASADLFGKALLAARQHWSEANRNGRRYSDRGPAQYRNSLAKPRRDGAR